jgi:putative nucleotidyltransferase with HDIG domain
MNRQQMIKKVESLSTLPTLPVVAMELNRMLQDAETPIEQLVELLERDQSMALKILRLVNSSFFGFKSRVTSLRHAVTLLGYSTVQSAVVTVSVIDALKMKIGLKQFDISTFWSHSIAVAVMGRHLATRTKLVPAEEAFTAGLLHDIGKVVLVKEFPEIFVRILETRAADRVTFYEAERALDSWPHTRIGSHLAKRWMLPAVLVDTIHHHHYRAGSAADSPMANLIGVADILANIMEGNPGYRLEGENLPPSIKDPMVRVLKDSANWFPEVKTEIVNAGNFFRQG